jgi:ParB-like nuclease family protein
MTLGIIVKGVKVTLKEVNLQRCLTMRSTRKNQNNYFKKEGCYEIDRMGSNRRFVSGADQYSKRDKRPCMKDEVIKIPVSDIVLDESIYPRENLDHKRIGIFVENLRDGFEFDPILVQAFVNPELSESSSIVKENGKYRILDGAHRWTAFKKTGRNRIPAIVKILNGIDPLLYAAKLAIGPKQLTEAETRDTARRAFQSNPKLTSSEIGKAIGRSRQAVDLYIADLRATTLLELDLKIFRLNQLGIPQDRIAKRLGIPQKTLSNHSAKMPTLAKWLNNDLSKGFTVPQVALKHGWPEPMVWSQALKGKDDQTRFKELNWGIRTYPKGQKLGFMEFQ